MTRSIGAKILDAVAAAAILGIALVLLAARYLWIGDLLIFFVPWIAAGAIVVLMVTLAFRARWVAAATAVLLVVSAIPIFRAWSLPLETIDGLPLRVTTFNTLGGRADPSAVADFLESEQPDILVFQEYSMALDRALGETIDALYEYRSFDRDGPVPTVALFSRYPIVESEWISGADIRAANRRRLLRVEIEADGRRSAVYAVHPPTPRWREGDWQQRNNVLDALTDRLTGEEAGIPIIVAGDFNTPPWSPFYFAVLDAASLTGTSGRLLPAPTRIVSRAGLGDLFGAPVDHVLVSAGIGWTPARIGLDLGSDHRPVTVDLVLP